ncbi:MAG: Marinomonas phage CPP1m [Verrucomicrobiota bacterium]|jgi:GH24 family phage-related lysozyme (muramidase)
MIRLPDTPTIQSTGLGAPTVSAEAAAAPARALGSIAGAIGQTSEQFVNLGHNLARVDNARLFAEAQTELEKNYAEFQSDLAKETDPQARLDKTNTFFRQQEGALVPSSAPPAVRAKLASYFTDFSTRAKISTAEETARLGVKRATLALGNRIDVAEQHLNQEDHRLALDSAEEAGILLPEQREELQRRFDRKKAITGIASLIYEKPLEAKEELESEGFVERTPGISEADRIGFLKKAEEEISGLQRDSLKLITDMMDRGEIVTEADLEDEMKDNPVLDEGYKDELRFSFTQKTPVDAETRFALVDSLNDLHDAFASGALGSEDYRMAHDELARAVYSLGARDGAGALRQRVHALDPANWSETSAAQRKLKEADKSKTLLRSVESISKLYAGQNAFGGIDEDAEPAARAEQAVAAQQMRLRIEAEMGKWIAGNPEATEEEISTAYRKTYMSEITGPILEKRVSTPAERRRVMLEELEITEESAPADDGPKGASNATSTEPIGGNLKEMVKHFEAGGAKEGFHSTAYEDYGQYSIGYGTKAKPGETITKAEAEKRLDAELASHRKRVVAEAARVGMEFAPHELDALTSFDFNTGRIAQLLADGTRTKQEIASKMLLYRKAGGKRLVGLERRRIAEANLFRRGYGKQKAPAPESAAAAE